MMPRIFILSVLTSLLAACATNEKAALEAGKLATQSEAASELNTALRNRHMEMYEAVAGLDGLDKALREAEVDFLLTLARQINGTCEASMNASYAEAREELQANFITSFDRIQNEIEENTTPLQSLDDQRAEIALDAQENAQARPADIDAQRLASSTLDSYLRSHALLLELANNGAVTGYDQLKSVLNVGLANLEQARSNALSACEALEDEFEVTISRYRRSRAEIRLNTDFPTSLDQGYSALDQHLEASRTVANAIKLHNETWTLGPQGLPSLALQGALDAGKAAVDAVLPPSIQGAIADPGTAIENFVDWQLDSTRRTINQFTNQFDGLVEANISSAENEIENIASDIKDEVDDFIEENPVTSIGGNQ